MRDHYRGIDFAPTKATLTGSAAPLPGWQDISVHKLAKAVGREHKYLAGVLSGRDPYVTLGELRVLAMLLGFHPSTLVDRIDYSRRLWNAEADRSALTEEQKQNLIDDSLKQMEEQP